MLFVYNTKKNPLEFAVSRGLVFIFSFGFFGPQVQAPISGVWQSDFSRREILCHVTGI
jgi:hypothetical protein